MKRGGLFLIGLLSAIITIISLNFAFGRPWSYYNHYAFRRHYYNYDNRCYDGNHYKNHSQQKQDSSTGNY